MGMVRHAAFASMCRPEHTRRSSRSRSPQQPTGMGSCVAVPSWRSPTSGRLLRNRRRRQREEVRHHGLAVYGPAVLDQRAAQHGVQGLEALQCHAV
mmetsp:Transcript_48246/g.121822  ORF Transcript_48246/g.121822 Transcript_48246/m.121822 type:complete len:96 (-) Transcript_48246:698-985(-)